MKKNSIELVKGLKYIDLYRNNSYILELRFNDITFCVRFSEVSEEDLAKYGFRFKIDKINCEWNTLALKDGFKEIEKDYKTTNILDLKDTFSKYLLKELKNDLIKSSGEIK